MTDSPRSRASSRASSPATVHVPPGGGAPARLAVFLRGINLGRRRVKNDELAAAFLAAGFTGVETYQASGNIVIDGPGEAASGTRPDTPAEVQTEVPTDSRLEGPKDSRPDAPSDAPPDPLAPSDLRAIEARIEAAVHRELGFQADAFLRTLDSLAALVEHEQLVGGESEGLTPHIIFLKEAPDSAVQDALGELEGPDDRFPALGCEVVWLRRGRLTDSDIQPRHLEKALGGVPNTMRKVTTLRRMVRKFGSDS